MNTADTLENKLKNCLDSFNRKESEILHYEYYVQNLVKFEEYLASNNLIEKSFEGTRATVEKYKYNKQRLEEYNKSIKIVSRELSYKLYYQNFEEFLSNIFQSIYSIYPNFLKKETEQTNISYDTIFTSKSIEDIQFAVIEKKVKELIQSNNIINLIKKLETIFGVKISLTKAELNLLFVASQNRNILTHNSGKFNSIYFNELKKMKISTKYNLDDNIIDNITNEIMEVEEKIGDISNKIFKEIISKKNQIDIYSKNIS